MTDERKDQIAKIVAENMGLEVAPGYDQDLSEVGVDSLDVVEIVMAVEESFGVEIEDKDIDTVRTVADIERAIAKASCLAN